MSNSNLHTCDKAAPGWAREGPCKECEAQHESNARLSSMFKDRVKMAEPRITAFACPPACAHKWDGPIVDSDDGMVSTRTCSVCGMAAIDYDIWRA